MEEAVGSPQQVRKWVFEGRKAGRQPREPALVGAGLGKVEAGTPQTASYKEA